MDDILSRELRSVQKALPQVISIYRAEIRRRSAMGDQPATAYALDFDVIFEFLNARTERSFGNLAVEALKERPRVSLPLLAGTANELVMYVGMCTKSATSETNPQDFLAWLAKTSPQHHARGDTDQMMRNMQSRWASIVDAQAQLQRLAEFLTLPNMIGVIGSRPPTPEIAATISLVLKDLSDVRSPGRINAPQRDYNDAINLAMVFDAWGKNSKTPLITSTRAVLEVSEMLSLRRQTDDPIAITPFTALVYFGLQSASAADIKKSLDKTVWLAKAFDHTSVDGDVSEVAKRLEEYIEFVLRLSEVSSLIYRTWKAPSNSLPPDLDLYKMAELTLAASERLGNIVMRAAVSLKRLAEPIKEVVAAEDQNTVAWRGIEKGLELLDKLPNGKPQVVIQVFQQFASEGASMSIYNVSQTGANNTAIVDSFKNNY